MISSAKFTSQRHPLTLLLWEYSLRNGVVVGTHGCLVPCDMWHPWSSSIFCACCPVISRYLGKQTSWVLTRKPAQIPFSGLHLVSTVSQRHDDRCCFVVEAKMSEFCDTETLLLFARTSCLTFGRNTPTQTSIQIYTWSAWRVDRNAFSILYHSMKPDQPWAWISNWFLRGRRSTSAVSGLTLALSFIRVYYAHTHDQG